MTHDLSRLANLLASLFLTVAGIVLLWFVFPVQIPAGLEGDLSSGHYPRAIMLVWIGAASTWFVLTALGYMQPREPETDNSVGQRSVLIILVVGIGYGLFATVGFLVAAFMLIVSLAHICGERGWAPWILGATVPPCVYAFLDFFLEVSLPSSLM